MGCHAYFYRVLDKPSFDIKESMHRFINQKREDFTGEFNSPWNRMSPDYPFYHAYRDDKDPLTGIKFRVSSTWFEDVKLNNKDLSTWILPLKNNHLLYKFRNKAFQIPCVQYKGRKSGLVKTYPQFLEFEELECPWIRIYPYEAMFVTKESFLKHLKSKTLLGTKLEEAKYGSWHLSNKDYDEYAAFFNENFINGEHLISLH